jgi:hypothetical protein
MNVSLFSAINPQYVTMKITPFAITVAAAQVPYVASQVKRLRSRDQRMKATGTTVEWGRNQAEAVVEPYSIGLVLFLKTTSFQYEAPKKISS